MARQPLLPLLSISNRDRFEHPIGSESLNEKIANLTITNRRSRSHTLSRFLELIAEPAKSQPPPLLNKLQLFKTVSQLLIKRFDPLS
jgi:hypothetical protein